MMYAAKKERSGRGYGWEEGQLRSLKSFEQKVMSMLVQ